MKPLGSRCLTGNSNEAAFPLAATHVVSPTAGSSAYSTRVTRPSASDAYQTTAADQRSGSRNVVSTDVETMLTTGRASGPRKSEFFLPHDWATSPSARQAARLAASRDAVRSHEPMNRAS